MFRKLMELLFPPKCIFCNQMIQFPYQYHICTRCYQDIKFSDHSRSWPIRNHKENQYFDGLVYGFLYDGVVKEALKKFKFYGRPSYFRAFAAMLSERLFSVEDDIAWDMVIGVPLHKDRMEERGFNQSQLLAKELSKILNIPEGSYLLQKIKKTKVQSLLTKQQRLENVRDAFQVVEPNKIYGKKILLIDDIYTTGNTVNECAKVLREAGASQIIVGVIASVQKT